MLTFMPLLNCAAYERVEQVAANYTCSGQPSAYFDTTNVVVTKKPTLRVNLGRQPAPSCGGKPVAAIFRYRLAGVQAFQDFNLTADVPSACTAKLISRKFML
jgi:hypothetical protein